MSREKTSRRSWGHNENTSIKRIETWKKSIQRALNFCVTMETPKGIATQVYGIQTASHFTVTIKNSLVKKIEGDKCCIIFVCKMILYENTSIM